MVQDNMGGKERKGKGIAKNRDVNGLLYFTLLYHCKCQCKQTVKSTTFMVLFYVSDITQNFTCSNTTMLDECCL